MSIGAILTLGYGVFGGKQLLPTLGYGISSGIFGRSGLGGDDVPRRNPNKGWDKAEWKRLRKDPLDAMESTLRKTYAELTQDAPIAVLAKVEAIVRPVAKVTQGQPHVINWSQLAAQYERANALYKLWQEEQDLRAAIDEEDELLMMML